MIELSHTRAAVATGCWQKYKWRYVDGLEPIRQSSALTLGRIMHDAFYGYYTGKTDMETFMFIKDSFDKEIAEIPLPDQDDLAIAKFTALAMWKNYPHKDLSEFQENYPEESFTVPLARGIHYTGRVDGRIKVKDTYWVREMKVTGLSQRQFEGRARTSSQATGYVYAMRKKGYDVKGIMFEVLKRPMLRKRVDETVNDFGRRIYEDMANPTKRKLYYGRYYFYRNETEVEQFKQTMIEVGKEIRRRDKDCSYYRNTAQCWNFNAECPYLKICFQEKPDDLTLQLYFSTRETRRKKDGGEEKGRETSSRT